MVLVELGGGGVDKSFGEESRGHISKFRGDRTEGENRWDLVQAMVLNDIRWEENDGKTLAGLQCLH